MSAPLPLLRCAGCPGSRCFLLTARRRRYSSSGHDGLVDEEGLVKNDETVAVLVKQALSHAEAGCDVIGIPTPQNTPFLGRFSPVFRRFSAVPLRCPAS